MRTPARILLALIPLALAAHAGAADWPIFRGDPALRGVARDPLPERPHLRWTYTIGQPTVSSPVIAGRSVFIGADDGKVHCIDLLTGEARWTFETGDMIEAPPLVHAGRVYVGSSDAVFYALDLDGALIWKHATGDQVLGSANVVRGGPGESDLIVAGSYDFSLYAFDAATGEVAWTYTTGDRLNGAPAVWGDRVIIGGCDTNLHIVGGRTGERIASLPMGEACHIAASVGVEDDKAYFGHYGNEYVCVDLTTHDVLWRYQHPSQAFFSPPAIGASVVVFGGRDKRLHCVDKVTGERRWSFSCRRKVDTGAVIAGDRVVFTSADGRIRILSLADGEELWSYDTAKPISSSPAVASGVIVTGSGDGNVYAFSDTP